MNLHRRKEFVFSILFLKFHVYENKKKSFLITNKYFLKKKYIGINYFFGTGTRTFKFLELEQNF